MKSKNKHCRWTDWTVTAECWANKRLNMVSELRTNSVRYSRRIKYNFHWHLLTIYMINCDYCWKWTNEQMEQWLKISHHRVSPLIDNSKTNWFLWHFAICAFAISWIILFIIATRSIALLKMTEWVKCGMFEALVWSQITKIYKHRWCRSYRCVTYGD